MVLARLGSDCDSRKCSASESLACCLICNRKLQSATKIRRSRFRRAYTDAASETLTPGSTAAAGQVLATSAVVPPVSITVRDVGIQ
ncbi:hypothetical protein OUZ56_007409 [Daphnia magna]|uniref:Uncharacterized protein n=1 Tax=Daphnia magna TaxID=35525 RepID=A0ABR0A9V6_9CRUS|nr:hypothetical protein OUZ56_007409 [Daphnia magna]